MLFLAKSGTAFEILSHQKILMCEVEAMERKQRAPQAVIEARTLEFTCGALLSY
jgi:hypothetical protein